MKKVVYSILIFISIKGFSQNLVLNPSFEDFSSCPNGVSNLSLLNYVYNPTANSPDFFSECSSVWQRAVPQNVFGNQFARTDSSYVGFAGFYGGENRDYISMVLSMPLIMGKEYHIEFYVSLGDSMKYSITNLGAYIHSDSLNENIFDNLPFQPQIENPSGNYLSDKINWTKIEGNFLAGGGEKYITIGNFYPDSLTDTLPFNNNPINGSNWYAAYYYLDDVSVTEIIDTAGTVYPIDSTLIEANIFPNPNNGVFTLDYQLGNKEKCIFKMYDAIGKLVYQEKLIQNNGVRNLQLELSSGVYVWKVESGEAVLKREKLVIQR